MNAMAGWTPERITELKKLWADGLSASEIAKALGGLTRNAVIGKLHRVNLADIQRKPRSRSIAGKAHRKGPASSVTRDRGNGGHLGAKIKSGAFARPAPTPKAARPEPALPPTCEPVTLENLGSFYGRDATDTGECRFVIGDAKGFQTLFCGAPKTAINEPYCAYHAGLCFNGKPTRKPWTPETRAAVARGRVRAAANF